MRKILSLFAAILFAGSMMAETPKVTLDFTSGGVAGLTETPWGLPKAYVTTEASYTKDGKTITITANTAKGHKAMSTKVGSDTVWTGIIFGQKDIAIKLPAFDFAVSKIMVYGIAGAGAQTTTNIFVGTNAVSTQATGCIETNTFEIAKDYQAAGNIYALTVTNAKNAQCSKIEIYEAVVGAPENPTFSVAAGVYDAAQSVSLACATEGAEIFYTLDGTEPSASSTKFTAAIPISETTTIKAIAIKNSISSGIVSARYKIITLEGNGSESKPYTVADVIALENSRPAAAWVTGYIVGALNSAGTEMDNTNATNIAIGATADATIDALVPVQLVNNTNPRTDLNVVDNPSNIGQMVSVHGTLELYCQKTGVKNTDDYKLGSVTVAVEKPVFTPAAGTYNAAQNVTIACATEGADIFYTLDGTEPTASSTKYTAAIAVSTDGTHTIKAIAIKGSDKSEVVTAVYKIMTPKTFASLEALVAANLDSDWPVTVSFENVMINDFYVNGAEKTKGIYVDVQKDDEDIEIFYDKNNVVVPDAWGIGGLISGTIVGKWSFYTAGDQWELVPTTDNWNWTSLEYTAPAVEAPRFTPVSDGFFGEVEVTLTCATEGAKIYYTLDNSNPTASSTEYTAPFTLTETTAVKAIAIKGSEQSEIAYKKYTKAVVMTCAAAREAALDGNTDPAIVEGYVTKIAYAWKEGSMSFWMADTKDGGEVIEAYKCAIANEADAPAVGDRVRVSGTLTKYNTTPEFAQGCTCVILEKVPTAIDNNVVEGKAVKRIENGMLIIEKNGVRYNALGQAIR